MLLGNSFEHRFNSRAPNGTAGPVMIICLSISGCLQSKNQFNERIDAIQVDLLFLLLDQEEEKMWLLCLQGGISAFA